MPTATLNLRVTPRRMISTREAAEYCGMSIKRFPKECPVRPVLMPTDEKLYDIHDLDEWINRHKEGASDCDEDILGRLKE